MKNYGYKVCYKQQGKHKLKIYAVVNTYDFALWHTRWYERDPPKDTATKNVIWLVIPIKNYFEYKKLWKGCPF